MHPAVARNLSLDTVPCPDPYVERLLDGVAFLAARTRLKVDAERSRFSRSVLDVLYPDLVTPAPATAMAVLKPGQQVQTMLAGHVVKRDTRLVSSLQPGLSTRCTFTTGAGCDAVADRDRLRSAISRTAARWPRLVCAPIGDVAAEAALRITIQRAGKGILDELDARLGSTSILPDAPRRPLLFDTMFGATARGWRTHRRQDQPADRAWPTPRWSASAMPKRMMPRTRSDLRRLPPAARIFPDAGALPLSRGCAGLQAGGCASRAAAWNSSSCSAGRRPNCPTSRPPDFELFATPIINLFERECNVIEIDRRKTRQVVHADRTRPRDFEIYRVTRVEDADIEGPDADVPALFSLGQNRGSGWVYSTERRPRRPTRG